MKNKTASYKSLNKVKIMPSFFIAEHKHKILGSLCSLVSVLCLKNTNAGLH